MFGEQLLEVQQRNNARRRTIYAVTFTAAAVLVSALIVFAMIWSLFHIDELPPPQVAVTFFAAMPPPPPPPPARKKQVRPRPRSAVLPAIQQPEQTLVKPERREPEPDVKDDRAAEGEAEGGSEGGAPGGAIGGVLGDERDEAPPPPPRSEPPPKPKVVPPPVLESQKISGAIPPLPPDVKNAAFAALGMQPGKLTATFKVCIGPDGAIAQATLIKSSGAPPLDDFIRLNLRTWRYRPYLVDGKPIPICGAKVFDVRLE